MLSDALHSALEGIGYRKKQGMYLNSLSIRNGGSAALDFCRSASGSNVAYVELKLHPYGNTAASVIIEEAGDVIR